jgi:hypothetical protein
MYAEIHVAHLGSASNVRTTDGVRGTTALARAWREKLAREYGAMTAQQERSLLPLCWSSGGGRLRETRQALLQLARRVVPDNPRGASRLTTRWLTIAACTIYRENTALWQGAGLQTGTLDTTALWSEPPPEPWEYALAWRTVAEEDTASVATEADQIWQ